MDAGSSLHDQFDCESLCFADPMSCTLWPTVYCSYALTFPPPPVTLCVLLLSPLEEINLSLQIDSPHSSFTFTRVVCLTAYVYVFVCECSIESFGDLFLLLFMSTVCLMLCGHK